VHFAIGDVDEGGNVAAQVEQRMHFDGSLGGAEARPRKDAQSTGRWSWYRVRRPSAPVPPQSSRWRKLSGDLNKAYREILVDVPVALFVGIGQRALGDVATDAQVIKLGSVSAQTGFDVAQAFAVS